MQSDLIFDVGLHKGEDTAFYLKKGYRVVAFEANPDLVAACSKRFGAEIAAGKLEIVEGAIAPPSVGDFVTFYQNKDVSIWGTIDNRWAERNAQRGNASREIKIQRVDAEQIFATNGIPYFLKIDIEGADMLVLEALEKFPDRPRFVSIESDKVRFDQLVAELQLLKRLGYTKFKAVQQRGIGGTTLQCQSINGGPFTYQFEECSSGPFGDEAAGTWLSYDEVLERYTNIFELYRRFGDNSKYTHLPLPLKGIISLTYRMLSGHKGPLPGWFDTHATL